MESGEREQARSRKAREQRAERQRGGGSTRDRDEGKVVAGGCGWWWLRYEV